MADLWRTYQRPLLAALLAGIVAGVSVLTRYPGSAVVAGASAVVAATCLIAVKYLFLRPEGDDDPRTEHLPE